MSSEKDDKQMIQLQVENWDRQQKLAIAQLANDALSNIHPSITHDWGRQWQERIYNYLQVTPRDLATCHFSRDKAVDLVASKKKDIRIDVLVDFLAVAVNLDKQGTDSAKATIVYDARARCFLFELAYMMKLESADVAAVERSIAQQMYFALQENSKDKDPHLEDRAAIMDQSAKKTIAETNTKKKAMHWLATGAGVLGGGALIALTGGLAAPLLAPLLVGITGATFFATAGGVALITSLFGLTGGGLAGWKMHRRMQGLKEFQFQQILSDADLPPIPTLQCTICVSGYYLEDKDEFRTPWERGFAKARNFNDIYCLQYESDALLDLGIAFRKSVKNQALRYAGLEVAKQTALRAFFAAVSLPATLLKLADVIDNPWLIAADRSRRAGVVLADILEQRVQGNRPCSLVGYSCGCLVIWHCLQELYARGKNGLVDHVVFMGAPISSDDTEAWLNCLSVVSGRIVNCYTDKDWVLAFVYRLHSMDTQVAGLQPIKNIPRIENVQLHLDGHTEYRDSVEDILNGIHFQ